VQHVYHGRWGKRKGGLAGRAPSIFGKYIANLFFLKVYNKVKICLQWKNKFGNLNVFSIWTGER
jgi:hypothetical protein